MTRLHTDPVEVRTRDDEPEQFLWRGRLYVVREVLARWTESGSWWQGAAVAALHTGESSSAAPAPLDTTPLPPSPLVTSRTRGQRAWGEPAPDVGTSVGPAGIDDREQSWFRVEAGQGRYAGTGVYDLSFAWTTGSWSLARVLD